MTELEIKVDNEIGNDTEHQRVTLLKYVNYGRRLQLESTGSVTKEELEAALQAQATAILGEVDAVLKQTGEAQAAVEQIMEDQEFEKLKQKYSEDHDIEPVKAFGELLDSVDAKHTEIIKTIREPGLAAIRAKYVKAE